MIDSGSKNIILYGPPGTGKTYKLKDEYFEKYTSESDALSLEEWQDQVISDLPWLEVFAAALYDLGGGPVRIRQIYDHKYVQAKARLRGLENFLKSQIWQYLQTHTSPDCEAVRASYRREPYLFWKNENSEWRLADGWQEDSAEIVQVAEQLRAGPPASAGPIKRYEFVTFHQSYSYEEFVEGIRPVLNDDGDEQGGVSYVLSQGVFKRLCARARRDAEGRRYALFIDEINRGNISKIFGELITLIEEDKREGASNALSAILPYSKESFYVPANLDIVGTMNTADRSLTHIDTALRRRFEFRELMPEPHLLEPVLLGGIEIDLARVLIAMNKRIEAIFDREHMIGHAYFLRGKGETIAGDELPGIFRHRVIPLLTEYFFDDWAKVRTVLADDQYSDNPDLQFVRASEVQDGLLSGVSGFRRKHVYQLNSAALDNPEAYLKIYNGLDS
jgi:5-methylcytosine-specific restriction protein B